VVAAVTRRVWLDHEYGLYGFKVFINPYQNGRRLEYGMMARHQVQVAIPAAAAEPLWGVGHYGRDRHPPNSHYWWDNRTRTGNLCVIQWTCAGELLLRDTQREHRVPLGYAAIFAHPSESSYGMAKDARDTYEAHWIALRGAGLLDHWRGLAALRGAVLPLPIDGPEHRAMRRLCELAEPRARTGAVVMAAAVHAFVLMLWEGASMARASDQRPVELAIDAMLAAPTAPWSLKRLADEHGISREHLARAFHERVGEPPATWLVRQRVQRAIELLTATELPIWAVRDQAGFTSSHTLIRRVRAETGCSPVELRRTGRGGIRLP
jgi:AraC family transcriptional regulator